MKTNAGFTLIEVLVALAILAIALTAIIKATSQNIKDNVYLQNKTIATWVATEVLNEARAGILILPAPPGKIEKETMMLNRKWLWEAETEATNNLHIRRINVTVHAAKNDATLAQLETYIYAP